jgi:hypothetical protein
VDFRLTAEQAKLRDSVRRFDGKYLAAASSGAAPPHAPPTCHFLQVPPEHEPE